MENLKEALTKETNEKIETILAETNKKVNDLIRNTIIECNRFIIDDIGVENIKVHHYGDFKTVVDRYISLEEYNQFTKAEIEDIKRDDEVSFDFMVNGNIYEIQDYYSDGLTIDTNDISYVSFMKLIGFDNWIGMNE